MSLLHWSAVHPGAGPDYYNTSTDVAYVVPNTVRAVEQLPLGSNRASLNAASNSQSATSSNSASVFARITR